MIEKYKHINVNPWQFSKDFPVGKPFDVKLVDDSILCKCECSHNKLTVFWDSPTGDELQFCVDIYPSVILGWRLSV